MKALRIWLRQAGNTQSKLARDLGLSQPAVAKWIERGRIPAERVEEVSIATGLSMQLLRPDLYK